MPESNVHEDYRRLLLDVRRSVRYHTHRRAFFEIILVTVFSALDRVRLSLYFPHWIWLRVLLENPGIMPIYPADSLS